MSHDSKICQEIKMKRAKAAYGIAFGIGNWIKDTVSETLQNECFSILIDEGSINYSRKWLAILVMYLHDNTAITDLLCLKELEDACAQNLAGIIVTELKSRKIPLDNCIAVMSDSANMMRGEKGGVIAILKNSASHILDVGGCCLHHVHNSTSHAVSCFDSGIEELFDDLFCYLRYSKASTAFANLQELMDIEPLKFIRHVSSRWLQIQDVVLRFIQLQPALITFFEKLPSSEKKKDRVQRILNGLRRHDLMAYMRFLAFALKPLKDFELLFQSKKPIIHKLFGSMIELLTNVINSFVKSKYVEQMLSTTELGDIPLKEQLSDDKLLIGDGAKKELRNDHITSRQRATFFDLVRKFYTELLKRLVHYMPVGRRLLKSIQFLDPQKRKDVQEDDVAYAAQSLMRTVDLDTVKMQWRAFVIDAELSMEDDDVLKFWISEEIKTKYPLVSEIALKAIMIPHGNADTERVMSWLNRVLTKDKNRLQDPSLNGLLTTKSYMLSRDISSSTMVIDPSLRQYFRDAKASYMAFLKEKEQAETAKLNAKRQKEAEQRAIQAEAKRKLEEEKAAEELALKKRRLAQSYLAEAQRLMAEAADISKK